MVEQVHQVEFVVVGGTVTGIRAFLLLCEGVISDNMVGKEFSVGTFSFKEETNFIKFPTVEVVREVFLLYHMKIIPMAITHMPVNINKGSYEFRRQ